MNDPTPAVPLVAWGGPNCSVMWFLETLFICKQIAPGLLPPLLPFYPATNDTLFGDDTLGHGSFGTWHILPSISMVDSVACLRYAECPCPRLYY